MANRNEEKENEDEEEKQGEPGQETSLLNASADPFVPSAAQLEEQVQAYERFKEFYRRLFPEAQHQHFLHFYHSYGVAYHHMAPLHLPTAPTAMSEELRPRMTASYLYSVFQSLINSPQTNIPPYGLVQGTGVPDIYGNLLPITNPSFFHYSLLFQARIETKEVVHPRGGRVDKFVHLHIPNDGFLYRSGVAGTLIDRHNIQQWITLPSNHDMVSPQFAAFAARWFGTTPNSTFYYHPDANRFDLQFWVRPDAGSSNRLYLKLGFEPGFPIHPLFDD